MSGGFPVLELSPEDLRLMLAAEVYLGETTLNFQMSNYVHGRNSFNYHIIRLDKTWEKILLAARAIAAVDNPSDVCVIGSRPFTQRAVLKFAHYTRTTAIAGRFTPGAFTNQKQSCFREPRLLIVSDPRSDQQAVMEASAVNIPVIAFCTTDSPLSRVDIAIPADNKSVDSIAVCWWLLAREVRRIRGEDVRSQPWSVWPDLFLYRDTTQQEKVDEPEVRVDNIMVGNEYDAAEEWTCAPAMPVDTMGSIRINNTGFGATGGWTDLEAGVTDTWAA